MNFPIELRGLRVSLLLTSAMLSVTVGASGDDSAAPRTSETGEADEVLQQSQERVARIAVRLNGESLAVPERPVLRYGDPTRANQDGSLWIWSQDERPVAIMELYRNDVEDWVYVLNHLQGSRLTAEEDGALWWTPSSPTVTLQRLDAPAPGETDRIRLTQMRAIARRFAAHELWDPDNSRYELRLLSAPLHRYADDGAGVIDGAVFTFANGTNPEIVLLLEAGEEQGSRFWRYGCARMGHAEMHVALDNAEVWTVPRVDPTDPREAYWLYFDPAAGR